MSRRTGREDELRAKAWRQRAQQAARAIDLRQADISACRARGAPFRRELVRIFSVFLLRNDRAIEIRQSG